MKAFNLLGYTFGKQEKETWAQLAHQAVMNQQKMEPQANYNGYEYPIFEEIYDGEKTTGELGAPIHYIPSYSTLSARSWQAVTESDLAQIIVKAHVNWVIGAGLKLQAEPIMGVIEAEGFDFDKEKFIKQAEERFRLYAKTKESTYNRMYNFNISQRKAYYNAIVGGDVLIIDMVENKLPKKRIIDGFHVMTPNLDQIEAARERGNTIVHGVELNDRKEHIAFFVSNQDNSFTRIEARGKNTGKLQAYLLYGTEGRVDEVRGMPLLHAVLEKLKKLDRYNEAIVAGTEEQAKIPYIWEHQLNAEGVNPDLVAQQEAMTGQAIVSEDLSMKTQTKLVKKTFEKEPINTPPGTKLTKVTGGMETNQEAFTTGNFIYICAAVEIPYEVALMKYVNSFSSSRMASQSWQKILEIKRALFNESYNKPFYSLFLDLQVLSGKITADGYLTAMNKNDVILKEAYQNSRFVGPRVPQADPFKEVKAEELMVKNLFTSREEAIERLGSADDFSTVVDKKATEQELIDEKLPEPEPIEPNNNVNNE